MHFNFLVGNHYLTQGRHYCKNFLRSITQGISEKKKKIIQHDQSCQPIIKAGKSYIKDKGDFLEKFTNLGNIPFNAILVTANVVGLYPSIPHDAGLQALYERLEERADKKNSIY